MANLMEEEECGNKTESQSELMTASNSNTEDAVETNVETTAQDIKYDWYQREEDIIITLFVKIINKENVNIKFTDDSVSISLTDDKNAIKNLHLVLHDCIRSPECSYKIHTTKVEIRLKKLKNILWSNLEKKKLDCNVKQQINWDKIVNSETAGDETNTDISKFFQKIYSDGSDEVKKAMIKSFYESRGTVLTTNWNEASSQEVNIQPPDGLEWKKW